MDLSVGQFIDLIVKGGLTVVMFVVWYITYTNSEKRYQKLIEENNKRHEQTLERLFKLLEMDANYKELLTGILSRIEYKLDGKDKKN